MKNYIKQLVKSKEIMDFENYIPFEIKATWFNSADNSIGICLTNETLEHPITYSMNAFLVKTTNVEKDVASKFYKKILMAWRKFLEDKFGTEYHLDLTSFINEKQYCL